MHPQLRHARFNLTLFLLVLVPMVCAYLVLLRLYGPHIASSAFSFLGLMGLWGYGGRFYRRKPGEPGVVLDERDQLIRDRADLLGWRVSWLYWLLICLVPWFWIVLTSGIEAMTQTGIPLILFPLFYLGAFIVHQVTWSLVIIISYREAPQA